MATWATIYDVETYTGKTAEEKHLVRAEADIAMFIGLTPEGYEEEYANSNDIFFLRLATCWQSLRYIDLYDETFRFDVTSTSQDGWSANLTDSGIVLHPKAKWAIKQLSWTKSKTIGVNGAGYGDYFNNICTPAPVSWRRLP